jgi:hypothetical protein
MKTKAWSQKTTEEKKASLLAGMHKLFDLVRPIHGHYELFGLPWREKKKNPARRAWKKNLKATQNAKVDYKAVSCCSKCKQWFPTYEERNEHRQTVHSAAIGTSEETAHS